MGLTDARLGTSSGIVSLDHDDGEVVSIVQSAFINVMEEVGDICRIGGEDSYSVVAAWCGGRDGWWGKGMGGPRRESNRTELGVNREGHTYNEKGQPCTNDERPSDIFNLAGITHAHDKISSVRIVGGIANETNAWGTGNDD